MIKNHFSLWGFLLKSKRLGGTLENLRTVNSKKKFLRNVT